MALDWDYPLAYPIQPKAGAALVILRDAARYAQANWNEVRYSEAIRQTIRLLLDAAETGVAADIEAATAQFERAMMSREEI